jgi:predicted RNase H-like HicB family nuclease
MATVEIELENNAYSPEIQGDWRARKAYRCHVCLIPEDDGSYSAIVLNLPGCGSCGTTEKEAIENVHEAVLGVIESHIEAGEEVPWIDKYDVPKDQKTKRILVNA